MSLRKTATKEAPHATYKAGKWTWLVLKVNQPAQPPRLQYSTWMVAAKSPNTFGGWDMGDTYCYEVLKYAVLISCTQEFTDYMQKHTDGQAVSEMIR